MNDRLHHPLAGAKVNDLPADTATFLAAFEGQPDLAHLSDAARRVLASAAALFYRRGAAGTSVRDLTKACGLTPGALYNHFASKDDLLFAIVQHGHRSMEARLRTALAGSGPEPAAAFAAFVRAYVVGHLVQPELAQVVRREYLHLSDKRQRTIVAERRGIRRRLSAILAEGARVGVFDLVEAARQPDSATGAALMVLDMCSRTSEWFDRHGPADVAELAERYVIAAQRLVGARVEQVVPARKAAPA